MLPHRSIVIRQKLMVKAKKGHFEEFPKVLPDRSILKGDKNWWKMPKSKNSNTTFWVIFKHCGKGPKCAEFLIVCKNDVSYTLALPKEGKIFSSQLRMWDAQLLLSVFSLFSEESSAGTTERAKGEALLRATESQRSFPLWNCPR